MSLRLSGSAATCKTFKSERYVTYRRSFMFLCILRLKLAVERNHACRATHAGSDSSLSLYRTAESGAGESKSSRLLATHRPIAVMLGLSTADCAPFA